ncbi:MAG: LamG domain-containing protein [Chloroflexi bacterium CFX4]|nr:LamG domain-containing protein [Chloroflexi bacterium CFX4]MDL1921987.1 LamG domain-containing protein [Chloroflexi bacterium CFX3]
MRRAALLPLLCAALLLAGLALLWVGGAAATGSYKQRVRDIRPAALLAYWTLEEIAGTTAHDASGNLRHAALCTGGNSPTWAATYFADGASPAARFDGNDCLNAFTSSLASVFNGSEGTLLLWLKAYDGTVWSSFTRQFWASVDGSNLLTVHAGATANTLELIRIASAVDRRGSSAVSGTGWYPVVMTWSAAANEARFYLDRLLLGAGTSIGTFSGTISELVIGAGSTSGSFGFNGYLAHVALWNAALSPAEVQLISVVETSVLTPPPIGLTLVPTETPTPTATPTPDLLRYLPIGSGYGAIAMTFTAGEALTSLLLVVMVALLTFSAFLLMVRKRY